MPQKSNVDLDFPVPWLVLFFFLNKVLQNEREK